MKALREGCSLPGGLVAALFGRMVTSDVEANIDAAVHVAHAFTVHAEESESDYFTVVDDLQRLEDDAGADHIGETELTSGLFYGYIVLDRGMLLDNLSGDAEMAAAVAERLVQLIATVSRERSWGQRHRTATRVGCWSRLVIGSRAAWPRPFANTARPSLEKRRRPCVNTSRSSTRSTKQVKRGRLMSLDDAPIPGASRLSLAELASWSATAMRTGDA